MTSPTLRTVIVEDEPLARLHLRTLVTESPALELAGEAADGVAALALIHRVRPELVFLDMHLPELHGLAVLEQLTHRPQVVLTTAYDRYAVHAFELGAADYLLKPFGEARFQRAVDRVLALMQRAEPAAPANVGERVRELYGAVRDGTPLTRLFVREGSRVIPVPVPSIVRLEADDDYVRVITTNARHLITVTLSELHARLDPRAFVRVHRSHVVARDQIAALEPHDAGRWTVVLRNGERIVSSRTGTRALRELRRDG
jgi:two-component system, LytTR family, response regulator